MNKRLFVVFLLGFSSGLPLALLTSTLQAWFSASNMPVLVTGFLSLLGLPYVYRILWAPLLDRYPLASLGLRKSWMVFTQLSLLLGFNLMAFFAPGSAPKTLACIAFLLAILSATQDTCIDAHRTEYLPSKEHGLGASLATFGYRLALLLAGGLALIMADHLGFATTYRIMGLVMFVGVLATMGSKEPERHKPPLEDRLLQTFSQSFKAFRAKPKILSLILFILFYKLAEAFTTTTSGIVMPFLIQGLGFSLDTIGYINKILGIGAILAGGLVAGIALLRCSLYSALLIFGLIQALANFLFVLLAYVGHNLPLFATAVAADNFAAGLGSTALVALMMRQVQQPFTAAHFSFLVAIASLPRVLSGPIAAFFQMHLGWLGLYQLAFVLSFCFVPFLIKIKEQTKTLDYVAIPQV